MRDGLFNGQPSLNGIDDSGEHGEDDAAIHKEDAEGHRAAVEARECRERGGCQPSTTGKPNNMSEKPVMSSAVAIFPGKTTSMGRRW